VTAADSVHSIADVCNTLGEGPFWSDALSQLLWVDIRRGEVWAAPLRAPARRLFSMNVPVSSVSTTTAGLLIVTGGRSIWILDPESSAVTELVRLPGEPEQNRCNDAKVDPWGNLWIGTMNEADGATTGALWRLSRHGELERILKGLVVPNTLAWDPARGVLYFGDSARGVISAFDADADSPRLGRQRSFLGRGAAPGTPDGSALDHEGCLWNARWDGSCVVRISPRGEIVEQVPVAVRRPTSCAFGAGADLFVTSALPSPGAPTAPDDGSVLRLAAQPGGPAGVAYRGPTRPGDVRIGNIVAGTNWLDA
jgi:sugar lactone lactonase YvrE